MEKTKMDIRLKSLAEAFVVNYSARPSAAALAQFQTKWISVVVAIVQAAVEMANKQKFARWQEDVSSKLDSILSALADIQQQLRDLQVWTDERISEETRRQYHQRIASLCRDINRILSAIGLYQDDEPTEDQLKDLKDNFRDLRLVVDDLTQTDGYSHIMGVVVGATVALPLFELLGRKSEKKGWAVGMIDYLSLAESATDPHSLESARNALAGQFLAAQSLLNSRLNREWTTNYDAPSVDPIDPIHRLRSRTGGAILQTASGSVASGLTLASRRSLSSVGNVVPGGWYPELQRQYDMGDGADKAWADMYTNLEAHRQAALSAASRESTLAVQIKQIDDVRNALSQAIPAEE
jgi:hypothetical protein